MFYPWSGNTNTLVVVSNVTSFTKLHPTVQLFSGSSPFTLCVPTPPPIYHTETDMHRSLHTIFHSRYDLGMPVQKHFHSCRRPPSGLHLLYCRPRSAPQVPIGPCSTAPRSRYGRFYNICCLFTSKLTNSETY